MPLISHNYRQTTGKKAIFDSDPFTSERMDFHTEQLEPNMMTKSSQNISRQIQLY